MSKILTLLLGIAITALSATHGASVYSEAAIVDDQNVTAATMSDSSPTLVSVYVVATGKATTMVAGSTLQFIAYGKYSDGSVVELPESETNPVVDWNTSNHGVAKISRLGHATAMDPGSIKIEATVGNIKATPWAITVTAHADSQPPSVSCSANPSIVTPGGEAVITAVGSSPQGFPLSYSYRASVGSIGGTNTTATLQTLAGMGGLVAVTCTVAQQDGGSASATTDLLVATSSPDLDGAFNWHAIHDSATPGESRGSSLYPATAPPYDDARKFYVTYSGRGGERFSISFGSSTTATHFVYDTSVYIVDTSQLENLEMDINQVMSDGRTVIFATQCAGTSRTWEYTTDVSADSAPHTKWHPSNIPCNPKEWAPNFWHHVQIASSRDISGKVTYEWVSLDGKTSNFVDASGPSAENLGWSIGDLVLNFQLDGADTSSESITAYVKNLTIYRW
jgi:Bacterial Ig-like domain (group 2)